MTNGFNNLKSLNNRPIRIFKGESLADKITLTINRFYNDIDLSNLFAYFLIEFSDYSVDKFLFSKEVFDEEIYLTLDITSRFTRVKGRAKCQISFEGGNGVVIKSNVKEVDIKYSIDNPTENFDSVPSCLTQILSDLELKYQSFEDAIERFDDIEHKTIGLSNDGASATLNLIETQKIRAKNDSSTYATFSSDEICEVCDSETVRKVSRDKTELFVDGDNVFYADGNNTKLLVNDKDVFLSDSDKTQISHNEKVAFLAKDNETAVLLDEKRVLSSNDRVTQFAHNGNTVLFASSGITELSHNGVSTLYCDNYETQLKFDDNVLIQGNTNYVSVVQGGNNVLYGNQNETRISHRNGGTLKIDNQGLNYGDFSVLDDGIYYDGKKYPNPEALRTAQLEVTNLKNALFGSVLSLETDTNTEVDKGILSNNVVVDNEVYPIIDNTRALLSEVKGNTAVYTDENQISTLKSSEISGVKFYDIDGTTLTGEITFENKQSLKGIPNGAVDKLVVTKNENDDYYTLKKVANTITITFDGTESWSVGGSSQNLMQVSISNESVVPTHCISNYLQSSTLMPNQIAEKSVRMGTNTIYIRYEEITNPDGNASNNQKTTNWKTYLAQQYANGTPLEIVYQVATPTEQIISTTLTLEEVSAMRRNGGWIEVIGNDNSATAKPSIDLFVVCEKPSV